MTRRRRVFDIDMPEVGVEPPGRPVGSRTAVTIEGDSPRRGPMAAAVRENAEALRARREVEDRIRAENDALAHEHVRLKRAGLIVEPVATHLVDAEKLVRDRAPGPDDSLEELKASILAIGLSNPIRVERKPNGRFELIQGWRRLRAYIELEGAHQDGRFTHIPAGIVAEGDALAVSYRRMVDENLVRKDVSFAEMARLAQSFAADPATGCDDFDKAVATLFRSAGYQKRSYIRAFAELLDRLGAALRHPEALGRNLGLELRRRLDADSSCAVRLIAQLKSVPHRTPEEETAILRSFLKAGPAARVRSARPARPNATELRVRSSIGEMVCIVSYGRMELRGKTDFAAFSPERLEIAARAFVDALGASDAAP